MFSNVSTAIVGKNVTIDAAVGSTDITQTQKVSQGGINVGIGGAAGNVANAVAYSVHRADQVQDGRLKALYAAQAAQALFSPGAAQGMKLPGGQDGYDAVKTSAQGKAGIDFKIGIGGSSASSTTTSHDDTTYGSTIRSNGNVTIAATGGDVNIIGSQIAGQDIALAATHNLNLLSQAENHTLQSSNQNVSAGVGVLIGSSGFGIYAEAAGGKGSAHGNGITHTDSTVNANGTLTLISGNDTTVKGAQLTGDHVIANVGNNLLIQSEQDTDDYASKQFQGSGQVVIGMGGGGSGGGVSVSQTKVKSHYASVTDVSGLSAGSDGFDITVGGDTHLIGGVIASSADPTKNSLNTGTLTYESIHNEADYSASSVGIGGGYSTGGGGYGGSGFSGAPNIAVPQGKSSNSDTNSGIAQGTIIQRDGATDLSGLDRNPALDHQALKPIFDAQKVQENLETGQVAGQVGMTAAGDLASKMGWAEGSAERTVLHGVVGAGIAALGGGNALQGALGAAANQLVVQQMADYLMSQGYSPDSPEFTTMLKLASTAVGATVGGGAGAATALDGTTYNYLNHLQRDQRDKELAACDSNQQCIHDTNVKWDQISNDQNKVMADWAIEQGVLPQSLQDALRDTDLSSPEYITLLNQAVKIVGGSGLLTNLQLINEADGLPGMSATNGLPLESRNAIEQALLGPVFGLPGEATQYFGGSPEQVAAANEAGAVALNAVGATKLDPLNGPESAEPITFPNSAVDPAILDRLAANGVKFTPENVVATGVTLDGQPVFLETGTSSAGLQHIIEEHGAEFANIGVPPEQIPDVLMQAVTQGRIVGYQGSGTGRPIYEVTVDGRQQLIAITVGGNGFIVGANPRGSVK